MFQLNSRTRLDLFLAGLRLLSALNLEFSHDYPMTHVQLEPYLSVEITVGVIRGGRSYDRGFVNLFPQDRGDGG